jgi:hypothetical protein
MHKFSVTINSWLNFTAQFTSKKIFCINLFRGNNHSFETRTGPAGWPGTRPTRAWDRSGSKKKLVWKLAWWNPVDPAGQPRTRSTRVNPAETWLIFYAFSLQLVEVPIDVEVIPCSAYALLTIEQQKRE